jgi:hypothetical protein
MSTFSRIEVHGWPNLEVRQLDARLRRLGGGAQMWLVVGNPAARAAVGVEFPDNGRDADQCRLIVAEWIRTTGLTSAPLEIQEVG